MTTSTEKINDAITLLAKMAIPVVVIAGGIYFFLFGDSREDTQNKSGYEQPISFAAEPTKIAMPAATSNADKRGFGDFNGDGVEDMAEIDDDSWLKVGDLNYEVHLFYGYWQNGILHFKDQKESMALKLQVGWFSDQTKLDVADVNGDGFSDIVFSQYEENVLSEDEFHFAFAINDQAGSFVSQKVSVQYGQKDLATILLAHVDQYGDGEEKLDQYLKMDWGDMDGNGTSDLVLAWRDFRDAIIEVIYTESIANGIVFVREASFNVPEFLLDAEMKSLDVENYGGDAREDILVYRKYSDEVRITVGITTDGSIQPHKDTRVQSADFSWFKFGKFDSFDANGDGLADFVRVGTDSETDKKMLAYNFNLGEVSK